MRDDVRAKMREIEEMSNGDLLAELERVNPFGAYIGNSKNRVANMDTLLRYECGPRLEEDEGWA